VQENQKDDTG